MAPLGKPRRKIHIEPVHDPKRPERPPVRTPTPDREPTPDRPQREKVPA